MNPRKRKSEVPVAPVPAFKRAVLVPLRGIRDAATNVVADPTALRVANFLDRLEELKQDLMEAAPLIRIHDYLPVEVLEYIFEMVIFWVGGPAQKECAYEARTLDTPASERRSNFWATTLTCKTWTELIRAMPRIASKPVLIPGKMLSEAMFYKFTIAPVVAAVLRHRKKHIIDLRTVKSVGVFGKLIEQLSGRNDREILGTPSNRPYLFGRMHAEARVTTATGGRTFYAEQVTIQSDMKTGLNRALSITSTEWKALPTLCVPCVVLRGETFTRPMTAGAMEWVKRVMNARGGYGSTLRNTTRIALPNLGTWYSGCNTTSGTTLRSLRFHSVCGGNVAGYPARNRGFVGGFTNAPMDLTREHSITHLTLGSLDPCCENCLSHLPMRLETLEITLPGISDIATLDVDMLRYYFPRLTTIMFPSVRVISFTPLGLSDLAKVKVAKSAGKYARLVEFYDGIRDSHVTDAYAVPNTIQFLNNARRSIKALSVSIRNVRVELLGYKNRGSMSSEWGNNEELAALYCHFFPGRVPPEDPKKHVPLLSVRIDLDPDAVRWPKLWSTERRRANTCILLRYNRLALTSGISYGGSHNPRYSDVLDVFENDPKLSLHALKLTMSKHPTKQTQKNRDRMEHMLQTVYTTLLDREKDTLAAV